MTRSCEAQRAHSVRLTERDQSSLQQMQAKGKNKKGSKPARDEWDKPIPCCSICLRRGRKRRLPCPEHGSDKPRGGVSRHRPKSAANGKRFGEATNPGPTANKQRGGNKAAKKKAERKAALLQRAVLPAAPEIKEVIAPEEVEASEKPAQRVYGVVLSELSHRYWAGWDRCGLVTSRGNNKFYGQNGKIVVHAWKDSELVDELIGWKQLMPGCYERTEDDEDLCVPVPAFIRVTTPTMTIGTIEFLGTDRIYHEGLLAALSKRFPSPVITQSNLRAFTALASRDFPSLPLTIQVHTIHYFCITVFQLQQLSITREVGEIMELGRVVKGSRTFTPPANAEFKSELAHLGVEFDLAHFHRLEGVGDPNAQNVTDNGNFRIIRSAFYTPSAGLVAGTFDTPTNEHPKLYYTEGMSLRGKNDFLLLDKSGENVCKAMSRLTKSRDNEVELQHNQAAILRNQVLDQDLLGFTTNSKKIAEERINARREPDKASDMARSAIYTYFSRMQQSPTFLKKTTRALLFPLQLVCAALACAVYVGLVAAVVVNNTFSPYRRMPSVFKFRSFPKKRIYQTWFHELSLGIGISYEEPIRDEVEAKFKTELAKPGKNGRLFVTYSRSILGAGWIFDYLKKAFCVCHDLSQHCRTMLPMGVAAYVPDSQIHVSASLDEAADVTKLIQAEGLNMRIFSDDMSAVYRTSDIELLFDADISSCDAGNGFAMFYLLGMIFKLYGFGHMVQNQFRRLRAPIMIRNPSKRSEFVQVSPTTIFQGSGCPETTLVNDIASLAISMAFLVFISYYNYLYRKSAPERSFDGGGEEQRSYILHQAARAVGHKVTIEWRANYAQLQFLKHSPLRATDGSLINTRNIGAILRNLGRHPGDLTAMKLNLTQANFKKLSHAARYELYISNVVAGLVNEPDHIITRALRTRFPAQQSTKACTDHEVKVLSSARNHHSLPLSSLQERYDGEDWEWEELADKIGTLRYGRVTTCTLLDQIMKVDYGL